MTKLSKRIIYTNEEGGLSVVVPAPKSKLTVEQIAEKDVPSGVDYKIVDIDKIPEDRYFRDAWKKTSTGVGVDLPKAREVKMDKIRRVRNEKLKELDLETMKGNDVQAEKQVLRDLPDNTDLSKIKTSKELKEFTPKELK